MKRLLIFPLLTLLATLGCFAQVTPNDSIRGKIREIKLSGAFVYAEASSMTNADEAQQVSLGKLEASAISLMAENQMDKESIKSTWSKAKDKVVTMQYKNSSLHKVFSCIPKSALFGVPSAAEAVVALTPPDSVAVLASLAPADAPGVEVPDSAVVPVTPQEPVVAEVPEAADSAVQQVIVPKVAAPVSKIGEAAQATGQVYRGQTRSSEDALRDASTASLIETLAQGSAATAEPVKVAEPVKTVEPEVPAQQVEQAAPQPAPAKTDLWETMPEKEQRALKDLLNLDTYESVMMYLSSMKEDGRLMYGSLKKMIRPERSFLIVIKEGKLETILNKGTGDRINLRTMMPESVRNYIGCGIIWLQVFN